MNIEKEYIAGNLTEEGLSALRLQLASESEETIASRMELSWMNDDFDLSKADVIALKSVSRNVHRVIRREKRRKILSRTVFAAAAALIPVCIGFSTFFFHKSAAQSEQKIAISTGVGEQSTVTLPDGTVVRLNSKSELTYSPGSMFASERRVKFRGEAFFDVARDEAHPFAVDADQMSVTVLGTKFNLLSRDGDPTNCLVLMEGRVALDAVRSGERVIINTGEEALMDKGSAAFTVKKKKSPESSLSWLRKELVATNVTLHELFSMLEEAYGVTVEGLQPGIGEDFFTGTLPSDNLAACATIIEYAYGIRLKILDDRIQVTGIK